MVSTWSACSNKLRYPILILQTSLVIPRWVQIDRRYGAVAGDALDKDIVGSS